MKKTLNVLFSILTIISLFIAYGFALMLTKADRDTIAVFAAALTIITVFVYKKVISHKK
jgi:hypothetical protein